MHKDTTQQGSDRQDFSGHRYSWPVVLNLVFNRQLQCEICDLMFAVLYVRVQNLVGVLIEEVASLLCQNDLKILHEQVCLQKSCSSLALVCLSLSSYPPTRQYISDIYVFYSLSVLLYHGYRSLVVDLPCTSTINELKQKLADLCQIPVQNQRIFYGNTQVCSTYYALRIHNNMIPT